MSAKWLETAGASDAIVSGAYKFLAADSSGIPEVYVQLDVYVCAALLTGIGERLSGDYFEIFDLYGMGGQTFPVTDPQQFIDESAYEGLFTEPGPIQWTTELDNSLTIIPTPGLHTIDIHLKFSDDTYVYKIDGVTDDLSGMGFVTARMSQADVVVVGAIFPNDVIPNFVTNVSIGTTGFGSSDIFSDDFSSGDFSAWDGTAGPVSIVDEPVCPAPIANVIFDGEQMFAIAFGGTGGGTGGGSGGGMSGGGSGSSGGGRGSGGGGGSGGGPVSGPTIGRWFVDSAYINLPVGPSPTIDTNSSAWMSVIDAQCPGGVFFNTNAFSTPAYYADATTPTVTITLDPFTSPTDTVVIPRPSGSEPDPSTDAHYVVIRSDTGDFWEFQGMDFGSFTAHSYATGNIYSGNAIPIAGRIATLCTLAGLVRPGEVLDGLIPHGIRISIPCASSSFRYPAFESDGSFPGGPPSGARMWLPTVPSGLDPFPNMVAIAWNVYGAWISDSNTGSSITGQVEALVDGSIYTIPIEGLDASIVSGMEFLAAAF